jgi:hypothetical protein
MELVNMTGFDRGLAWARALKVAGNEPTKTIVR